MREEWKGIDGYDAYEVSSLGRVKNKRGKVLKPHVLKVGYATVVLYDRGKPKRYLIHRLVATAFHGACPDGMQAAHEDGNRLNNKAENLSWKTYAANGQDKIRHGTAASRERHGRAILSEADVEKIRSMHGKPRTKRRTWGAATIARELGLPFHAVSNVVTGRTWKEAAQ